MKLRNKKTGEIKDFGNLQVYAGTENTDESQLLGYFDSFKQILEYYEDYIPPEPLIKDEKIRRAVRAWAECCCIPLVKHYLSNGLSCFICNDEEDNEYCLDFTFCINNLEAEHIYSIEELCGEEEE